MTFIDLLRDAELDHRTALEDSWVVTNSKEIADRTSARGKTRRTWNEIYEDSRNGLALKTVVLNYLLLNGVNVRREEKSKVWDLNITEDGVEYKVDVKGLFKEHAKSWSITGWEASKTESDDVLYLCFDGRFDYFAGWANKDQFSMSQFGDGSLYIMEKALNE